MAKYNANFFMVDNVARPVPSDMSVTIQKLSRSDAGRCEDGVMHVNYVRRVRSIQFSWNDLPPEDIEELCEAFDGSDYFTVTYQDPKEERPRPSMPATSPRRCTAGPPGSNGTRA